MGLVAALSALASVPAALAGAVLVRAMSNALLALFAGAVTLFSRDPQHRRHALKVLSEVLRAGSTPRDSA